MTVVTRFPPSPTGALHIGSARTALFNWLYARRYGGRFLLRIEDTDRQRSTQAAVDSILDGLTWLGLNWDGDTTYQSGNLVRHVEVANQLLAHGMAYRCYCSQDELAEMRENARAAGHRVFYDRRWRDRDMSEAPSDISPVVRIKMPLGGETVIDDRVQGEVSVANEQLDDFVLLRADGTPTYMLSVVVDDYDAGVTHVIRGDDHLNNAFRQYHLYRAAGWEPPVYAHIPLIHGADGQKLSKRHGATSVQEYRDLGYLPEALRNYLLRLGWSHGDEEIIDLDRAVEWFDLDAVGRGAARFDIVKLENLNAHYIRGKPLADLFNAMLGMLQAKCETAIDAIVRQRIEKALPHLVPRARTLVHLADSAVFLVRRPAHPLADPKALKLLDDTSVEVLLHVRDTIVSLTEWSAQRLEAAIRACAEELGIGLGRVAQPLRAALTGSTASPGIFEVMEILGREETLARITAVPSIGSC